MFKQYAGVESLSCLLNEDKDFEPLPEPFRMQMHVIFHVTYSEYIKYVLSLTPDTDVDAILDKVKDMYSDEEINDIDGVKIDFADKWVHLRKSNTEPIIRVYSEAASMDEADKIGKTIMQVVYDMQKK